MRAAFVGGFIAVVLGCGPGPARRAPPPVSTPPAPTGSGAAELALGEAAAHERGHGRPRDYRAAAAIYARQCARGTGDATACRRLVGAIAERRGSDASPEELLAIVTAMCARDDVFGCAIVLNPGVDPSPEAARRLAALLAQPCDAAHLARCEVGANPLDLRHPDAGFDDRACYHGVLEACSRVRDEPGPHGAEARARLGVACDRGEAAACRWVGRPIALHALCAAHDWSACMRRGCAGDEAAARTAAEHDVTVDCDDAAEPPVATGVAPQPRPPLDPLELRPLGRGRFQVYNLGARPLREARGRIYWYESGRQTDGGEYRVGPLAPGAATTVQVSEWVGVTKAELEWCVELAEYDGHTAEGRCPHRKPRGVRWGDGRDNIVIEVAIPDVPLAHDLFGTLAPVLFQPFEQAHPGVLLKSSYRLSRAPIVLAPAAAVDPQPPPHHGAPALALPLVREPVAIAYQLDGVPRLQLSPAVLAGLLAGTITQWNDRAIALDNPGVALPPLAVRVFAGRAGDRDRVTAYLRAALGTANVTWLVDGTPAIDLAAPDQRAGGIGPVGPGVAGRAGLAVAHLRGPRGVYHAPTTQAITSGDYPLAATRTLHILLRHPDAARRDAVRAYAEWLLGDGLAAFEQLGYGREPAAVLARGRARLRELVVAP